MLNAIWDLLDLTRNQYVLLEFGNTAGQRGGILDGLTLCLDCLNDKPANASPVAKAGRAQF